jgi:ketosteroid isomerase-like protein
MRNEIEQRNVEIVERFRAGFAAGEGYLDLMVDDPCWRVFHSVRQGRDAIVALRAIAGVLYPNGNTPHVRHIVAEGDVVVVQQTITAITNKGEDYENFYVIVYELTPDGRIETVWEYLNNVYSQDKFDLSAIGR